MTSPSRLNQAVSLLEEGIKQEPQRSDLRLKLMEVHGLQGDRDAFVVQERQLIANGDNFAKVEELNETEEGVLVHRFDLDELEHIRSAWGSFRDRRPNLYGAIKTLDGSLES